MTPDKTFLPQRGRYRDLIAFRKAECIYDITVYFAETYLDRGDRTRDQMVQAARSGKQNIAEGSSAGSTSKETEIKLTNVAKASLQELLLDYEDYLRARSLCLWSKDDARTLQARRVCATHDDAAFYMEAVRLRSDETVANIAIVLIRQTDVILSRLIERQKADFLKFGGIKEEMTRARLEARSAGRSARAGSAGLTGSTGSTESTGIAGKACYSKNSQSSQNSQNSQYSQNSQNSQYSHKKQRI